MILPDDTTECCIHCPSPGPPDGAPRARTLFSRAAPTAGTSEAQHTLKADGGCVATNLWSGRTEVEEIPSSSRELPDLYAVEEEERHRIDRRQRAGRHQPRYGLNHNVGAGRKIWNAVENGLSKRQGDDRVLDADTCLRARDRKAFERLPDRLPSDACKCEKRESNCLHAAALPNELRLSWGALKKDSFLNLRAPSASSAG